MKVVKTVADERILYPGATIGVIGDDQSSVSLIVTAQRMGFKVAMYSLDETNEAMQMADYKYLGPLADQKALQQFAERCDVITYNSDRIDPEIVRFLSRYTALPQRDHLLEIMQDRLIERSFFDSLNINMAPYTTVVNLEDVYQGINSIGYPAILKPIQRGLLNGRQLFIKSAKDIVDASGLLDAGTYVLESFIEHQRDYAVVVTRDGVGNRTVFPTTELIYKAGQVTTAFTPSEIDPLVDQEIKRIANEIAFNLDYIGTFEITFFLSENGTIYVNKVAPNLGMAGLIFQYAANTDQFTEHLKAISGLPLTNVLESLPTVMQTIRRRDFERIKTQWVIKNDWHFSFYQDAGSNPDTIVGIILIPTESVSQTLKQIESTSIWDDIDFNSKYQSAE
ncbi:ATP-grasp domain-containing protein [Lentilactobacillus senioris]|uniref:ATP-grasp domain-containing protein n=1 Tax=Lentilactobacillus senioris TaxID=931534 RepID=UPI0022806204|nr:ATP-grasp domain-containing protein [Lentilactobacillus senioris]MCY9806670.1 ATP-grasp domain-containing protein [Lentilactobacillus senioris]